MRDDIDIVEKQAIKTIHNFIDGFFLDSGLFKYAVETERRMRWIEERLDRGELIPLPEGRTAYEMIGDLMAHESAYQKGELSPGESGIELVYVRYGGVHV